MPELDPHIFGEGQPCFGCSPDHPIGFHLRFRIEDGEVVSDFTPGENYQGPPGIMHGGLVSTLADEIAAWAIIGILGKFGFTAQMNGKFMRPVRVGVPLEGRAKITRETSRIVQVVVKIRQSDLDCYAGDFTFVLLDRAAAEKMLGRSLPESWAKFAR
ncbi:MAG: PaaI family thioesterase [Polyangiaceae bacterium]